MTTLYHYCPTESFYSIIKNHSIWLSSLSQSNDYMEGKLVTSAIGRLAQADNLNEYLTTQIQEHVELVRALVDGLGFCLSEDNDLLSQWRGYAADATGIAIGFSKDYLSELANANQDKSPKSFTLERVDYEETLHDAHVKPAYDKIRQLSNEGAFKPIIGRGLLDTRTDEDIRVEQENTLKANSEAFGEITRLIPKLFLLKSIAFKEEHEWRLISNQIVGSRDHKHKFGNNQIIPYREFELLKLSQNPIVEIVLGPKLSTPKKVIENFLWLNGFTDVKVTISKATYR